MKQISRLPDAELEVMQALWTVPEYPARTSDLAARLDRDWKAPTLLKLLSRLEERGFVRGEKEGRSNGYTPLVNRPDSLAAGSRSILERVHGGYLSSLIAALYPKKELSREDIPALAVAAFNDVCTGGNPRPTSVGDIEKLYRTAF